MKRRNHLNINRRHGVGASPPPPPPPDNHPPGTPEDINAAANTIFANAPISSSTNVRFQAIDPDGNQVTYPALTTNPGNYFSINNFTGDVLVAIQPPVGTYIVGTKGFDGSLYSVTEGFATITVLDVPPGNTAPSTPVDINAAANTIFANAVVGSATGVRFQAIDPDGNQVTYPGLTTNPGGYFSINSVTGDVVVAVQPPAGTYIVGTKGFDGELYSAIEGFATITVLAVVNNAPSTPVDINANANTLYSNAVVGSATGVRFQATDPDGNIVTYPALTRNPGGYFSINSVTGDVLVASPPPAGTYIVGTKGFDGSLYSATEGTATITVLAAPAAPPDAAVSRWTIPDALSTFESVVTKSTEVSAGTWGWGYVWYRIRTKPAFDPATGNFYYFGTVGVFPWWYGGNEVYRANGPTGAFTRLTMPSPVTGSAAPFGPPVSGPPAAINIGSFVFNSNTQTCFLFVADGWYTGTSPGGTGGAIWEFNPDESASHNGIAALTWRECAAVVPAAMAGEFYITAVVLANGDIRIQTPLRVAYYTPSTDTMGTASSISGSGPRNLRYNATTNLIWASDGASALVTYPAASGSTAGPTTVIPGEYGTGGIGIYGADQRPGIDFIDGIPYIWGGGSAVVKWEGGKQYRNIGAFPPLGANRGTAESVFGHEVSWGYVAADNRFYGVAFIRNADGGALNFVVAWRPPTVGWAEVATTKASDIVAGYATGSTNTLPAAIYARGFSFNKDLTLSVLGSTFGGMAYGTSVADVTNKAIIYGNFPPSSVNMKTFDRINIPGDQNFRMTSGGSNGAQDGNASISGFRIDGVRGQQAKYTLTNAFIWGCNNAVDLFNPANNPNNISYPNPGYIGYQNVSGLGYFYMTDCVAGNCGSFTDPGQSHNLYFGRWDTILLTRVKSYDCWIGHLYKSRARLLHLDSCWGIGRHNHSFLIDASEGGELLVHDSYFMHGIDAQQVYLIGYGKEIENNAQTFFSEPPWPVNTITAYNNLFISQTPGTTHFTDLRTVDASVPPGWAPSADIHNNFIIAESFDWGDIVSQGWASAATLNAVNNIYTGPTRYQSAITAGVVIPPNILRTLAAIMDVTTTDLLNPSTGEVVISGVTRTYSTFAQALAAGKVIPTNYYERPDEAPNSKRIVPALSGWSGLPNQIHTREDAVSGSDLVTTLASPGMVHLGGDFGLIRNGTGQMEVRLSCATDNEDLVDVGTYEKRIVFKTDRLSATSAGEITVIIAAYDHNNMIMFRLGKLIVRSAGVDTILSGSAYSYSLGNLSEFELVDDGTKSTLRTRRIGDDKLWDYELPDDIRTKFKITNNSFLGGIGADGPTPSSGITQQISMLEIWAIPSPEGALARAAEAAEPLSGFKTVATALSSQYAGQGVMRRMGLAMHPLMTYPRGTFVVTDLANDKIVITSPTWFGTNGQLRVHVSVSPSTAAIPGGLSIRGFDGADGGYFLRDNGDGTHCFYDTAAHAQAGGATGRINLTSAGTGTNRIWSHSARHQPQRDLGNPYIYLLTAYTGGMKNFTRETVVHYSAGHVTDYDPVFELDPHHWTYKKTLLERDFVQPISNTSNQNASVTLTDIDVVASTRTFSTVAGNFNSSGFLVGSGLLITGAGPNSGGYVDIQSIAPDGKSMVVGSPLALSDATGQTKTLTQNANPTVWDGGTKDCTMSANADGTGTVLAGATAFWVTCPAGQTYTIRAKNGVKTAADSGYTLRIGADVNGGNPVNSATGPQHWFLEAGHPGLRINHPAGTKMFAGSSVRVHSDMWPFVHGTGTQNDDRPAPAQSGYAPNIFNPIANKFWCHPGNAPFNQGGLSQQGIIAKTAGANNSIHYELDGPTASVWTRVTNGNLTWDGYKVGSGALDTVNNVGWFIDAQNDLYRLHFNNPPSSLQTGVFAVSGPIWLYEGQVLWIKKHNYLFVPTRQTDGYKIIDLNPVTPVTIVTTSTPNYRGVPSAGYEGGIDIDNVNDFILYISGSGVVWKIDVGNPDPTDASWTPTQMRMAPDSLPKGLFGGGTGSGDNGKWRCIDSAGAFVGPTYGGLDPGNAGWWALVPENYVPPPPVPQAGGIWEEIPNTDLSKATPKLADVGPLVWGVEGPSGIIFDWGGAAFDYATKTIHINHNGGHGGYGGNEDYRLDLFGGNGWVRWSNPSVLTVAVPYYTNADNRPLSAHGWGGLTYVPTIDAVFASTRSLYPSGDGTQDWLVYLGTQTYERLTLPYRTDPNDTSKPVQPYPNPDSIHTVYLPDRNIVLNFRYNTEKFDPVTKQITALPMHTGDTGNYWWGAAAYDQATQTVVFFSGGNGLVVVDARDLNDLNRRAFNPTTIGFPADAGLDAPGIDFMPSINKFVAWAGGRRIYLVDIAPYLADRAAGAPTVTVLENADGPAPPPGTGKIYGRFRCMDDIRACWGLGWYQGNVWLYRLPANL